MGAPIPNTLITVGDTHTSATLILVDEGDYATFIIEKAIGLATGMTTRTSLELSTNDVDALEVLHGRLGLLIQELDRRSGKARA